MKRRSLLIAAWSFAAISLGLNAYLLYLRDHPSTPPSPEEEIIIVRDKAFAPAKMEAPPRDDFQSLPLTPDFEARSPDPIDFSGTAFANGSWKLTDGPENSTGTETPAPAPESALNQLPGKPLYSKQPQ